MKKRLIRLQKAFTFVVFFGGILLLTGCNNQSAEQDSEKRLDSSVESAIDKNKKSLFKFDNVIFIVPSPYEFAYFVKNLGITYNKEYLNPSKNAGSYASSFKKAANLGVYGTDLGYLNIYEQTPDAVNYFATIKKMAEEVGVSSVFDQSTMKRIEKNMGNKDSIMFIISKSYREADAYLKDNERKATAAIVLAGSWIESLYILTQISKTMPIKEVYQRIAEQKHPIDNLIKILTPYYKEQDNDFVAMADLLVELANEYDGIDYKYEYRKPTHDIKNKITTVNSISELVITKEQVQRITKLTEQLRQSIINK